MLGMQETESILNFAKIVQQVCHFLIFTMSEEYITAYLKVETDVKMVATLQQYTLAFYRIQETMPAMAVSVLPSFRTILQKLATETTLRPQEALLVASLYEHAATIKAAYADQDTYRDQLAELFAAFSLNKPIIQEIRRVITKDAQIADDASSRLHNLRKQQKQIEQAIRQQLTALIISEKEKLAENLYTLRNNRYALPIKAVFKNTFAGILHDQSTSGSTFYIEPQALIQMNNTLQQLSVEEAQEIDTILRELSEKIFELTSEIKHNVEAIARFDIYQAKARYAYHYDMQPVQIVASQEIELYEAKHPLLQNAQTIGNDIILGKNYHVLMITGANAGGKSVFLKTVGLLSIMAQAGLFLPVDPNKNNRIGVFSNIFMVIGDEQSLEQNLSTFSAHIEQMKQVLQKSNEKTLVLLDELGSGTDPVQGAALAIAMLEALAAKKARIVGTTHFNELKAFMLQAPYAETATMIFDVDVLKPTYTLRYGSTGYSYAFDIAQTLALPSTIIANARVHAATFTDKASERLAFYEERLQALDEREKALNEKAAELKKQAAYLANKHAEADKAIDRARQASIKQAQQQLSKKLKQAEKLLTELKSVQNLRQNEYAQLKGTLNAIATDDITKTEKCNESPKISPEFVENDIVYIEHLQAKGVLIKKQGKKWVVKIGELSVALPEDALIFHKHGTKKKPAVKHVRKRAPHVPDTLDLRGVRVAEGLALLERYLANAQSNHQIVTIVHGHGTGQMRDAVHDVLRKSKSIKGFRFDGWGATIITFK